MKALTVRQPWASLIALGVKTVETRSWSTKLRGPIAIHAGKRSGFTAGQYGRGMYDDSDALWRLKIPFENLADGEDAYEIIGTAPLGVILATAEVADCVHIEDIFWASQPGWRIGIDRSGIDHVESVYVGREQEPLGDFAPGRWAWLLDDIKPTTERCPACWGSLDPPGRRVAVCPSCETERWHSIGPCSACDAPGTACPICKGQGRRSPISAKGRQGLWNWESA